MADTKVKPSRVDVIDKVRTVLRQSTTDPVEDLRACGEAMVAVADALKGKSGPEARAIIEAVAITEGISIN